VVVNTPDHGPYAATLDANVLPRARVDLLWDARFMLIECKSSNSSVNGVKRLNRETGGKAQDWNRRLGERAIPAAVLAGVFQLGSLKAAQASSRATRTAPCSCASGGSQ
jgi:hypothetical protein